MNIAVKLDQSASRLSLHDAGDPSLPEIGSIRNGETHRFTVFGVSGIDRPSARLTVGCSGASFRSDGCQFPVFGGDRMRCRIGLSVLDLSAPEDATVTVSDKNRVFATGTVKVSPSAVE